MTGPARYLDPAFFGHPRGLSTLFFTEMWERFSYYGMRALLILFMTASLANGGLGFDTATAGAIYGLYTSMVYMTTLPGGWIADRLIGQRRAVLYGGIIIASGHFCMAFSSLSTFYLGLFLIVIGTGLLKGNVSVIVGRLYAKDDIRRDAGFSIFYMGINTGAFIAPLVCGYLGQKVNWHVGFAAAGIGMTLGVIQYVLGSRNLGDAGLYPAPAESPEAAARLRRNAIVTGVVLAALIAGFGIGASTGAMPITARQIADAAGLMLGGAGFAILIWAAKTAEQGIQVSPMWLSVTYLLHTFGELCLSPVGLSAMTKLAPARIGGLMMGVWFLATSVGNFIGGRASSFYESWPLHSLFGAVGMFAIGAGILLVLFVKPIKRLMGEVN